MRLLPADAWRHTRKCKRLDLSTTRALDRARIGLGLYVARDDKSSRLRCEGNGFYHRPKGQSNNLFPWGYGLKNDSGYVRIQFLLRLHIRLRRLDFIRFLQQLLGD